MFTISDRKGFVLTIISLFKFNPSPDAHPSKFLMPPSLDAVGCRCWHDHHCWTPTSSKSPSLLDAIETSIAAGRCRNLHRCWTLSKPHCWTVASAGSSLTHRICKFASFKLAHRPSLCQQPCTSTFIVPHCAIADLRLVTLLHCANVGVLLASLCLQSTLKFALPTARNPSTLKFANYRLQPIDFTTVCTVSNINIDDCSLSLRCFFFL